MTTATIRPWERQYLSTLMQLRGMQRNGLWRGNRTGVRTAGGFGLQLDVPLSAGCFPALVTKTVHMPSVTAELLWFLRGETNIAYLQENKVRIWNEWADEHGELGPVYGAQWRNWLTRKGKVDQVAELIDTLRNNPNSRRMIVSAWNPADLPLESMSPQENVTMGRQALAPCHMLFQVYVKDLFAQERLDAAEGIIPESTRRLAEFGQIPAEEVHRLLDQFGIPTRGLCMRVDQRSADWFLGVPFNIASYALLTHLICTQVPNLVPYQLTMQFGDYHLYENCAEQADIQLDRFSQMSHPGEEALPALSYPAVKFNLSDERHALDRIELEDIAFEGYQAWGPIKATVAV